MSTPSSTSLSKTQMYCRICNQPLDSVRPVLDLGAQPLANNLEDDQEAALASPRVPLKVVQCTECQLVQLTEVVDPDVLFKNYLYTPSQSETFKRHFEGLAGHVASRMRPGFWVDIGSNDGLLLSYAERLGWDTLGIDPAEAIAAEATEAGIETWVGYWPNTIDAEMVSSYFTKADVISATNVFAHTDNIHGFVEQVAKLLEPSGVFILEFPYLPRMLSDGTFDLIYHEHLSYFHLPPLQKLLESYGLAIVDYEIVPIHGGSARVSITHSSNTFQTPKLEVVLPIDLTQFARRAEDAKQAMLAYVKESLAQGARVAGYGAPAKATVMIEYMDLGVAEIEYIVDDNPMKQGKFLPGSGIPVVAREYMEEDPPDIAIIFPWNVADDILPKLPGAVEAAVIPMPDFEVRTL